MSAIRLILCLTIGLWIAAVLRTTSAKRSLAGTSLGAAWGWGLVAELVWLVFCVVLLLAPQARPTLDQLGMWAAVLSLCPFISVLGARRPTNGTWNGFIIVPLIAILGWPALTVLRNCPAFYPLRVQAPVFVGIAMVLVMGVGNYLGTRFTSAALMSAAGVVLSLIPLSSSLELSDSAAWTSRVVAAFLTVLAVWLALWQARRMVSEASRFDRLWFDFRETFGIVWSVRIQERLNGTAQADNWACRLGPLGFEWDANTGEDQRRSTEAKLEHALRWHLRRFVNPEWIDMRLGQANTQLTHV